MPMLAGCGEQLPGNTRLCPLKDTTVAGVQARVTSVLFDAAGFRELHVAWRTKDYDIVVAELTRAYGIPCSQATTSERDSYETLTNITTQWCFTGGSMTLVKYADDFTATRLNYVANLAQPALVATIPKMPETL
ncbi:hypothetical protein ABAC402_03120 [Asticcacaulis sp. AC402]|nr:hypothetical protein ABAC402_03120 [Asticcacaulis sp. AC402]